MFLHAVLVAEEKYIIHLLLALALQFLLLSNKPCPKLFYLLPQSLIFLLDFLTLGLRRLFFPSQPACLSISRLSLSFSTFFSNPVPSSAAFLAAASSLFASFSLERRSSLSSICWAIYTLIALATSSRLKSLTHFRIKLRTSAST